LQSVISVGYISSIYFHCLGKSSLMAEAQICRRLGRRGIACKPVRDGVFSIEHGLYTLCYYGDGKWRLGIARGQESKEMRFESKSVAEIVNIVDVYLLGVEESASDEWDEWNGAPPGLDVPSQQGFKPYVRGNQQQGVKPDVQGNQAGP
jgi:hypothetical protein